MTHPLIDMLLSEPRAEAVSEDTLDAFLARDTDTLSCLFFTGQAKKRLETADVAVVLREFLSIYGDKVRVGVVDEASEKALMGRCAVLMLPSISVFHGDNHLKTFPKILDWQDYAQGMADLLAKAGI